MSNPTSWSAFLSKWLKPRSPQGPRRRTRLLHPEGMVFVADVVPLPDAPVPYAKIAERLRGEALVRLSGAWWRGGKEWKDVLGCAVRFLGVPGEEQDLLFATVRRPWTALLAALTTDTHDFLENDYYAAPSFEVSGLGTVKWRAVPHRARASGRNRWQKLARAVKDDLAFFRLEARRLGSDGTRWQAVAEIRLREKADIDQSTLEFSLAHTGRGIEPQGLIHGLRRASQKPSRESRTETGSDTTP